MAGALNLPEGSEVPDLCCGYGRHAAEIVEIGRLRVTGLDLFEDFIAMAEEKNPSPEVAFVRGDMRSIGHENRFNAVIKPVSKALKAGG